MVKTKTRGANLLVPQNREQAADYVRQIGEAQRRLARLEADMNDRIAAIKQEFETAARRDRDEIEAATAGLLVWAEANRDALTGGGKTKTVDLGTGLIAWRARPPRVTLKKIEDVIAAIKRLGLTAFLRTKEEVDKEAMLKDPANARLVPGVTIGSAGEDFAVEPFEIELAEAAR